MKYVKVVCPQCKCKLKVNCDLENIMCTACGNKIEIDKEKSVDVNKKNIVKKIIIASMIVLIIIALFVASIIYFSPINIIKRAISKSDYTTVVEKYSKLNNRNEKEYVKKELINYSISQNELYLNKQIDFEQFASSIEDFKPILKNEDEYNSIITNSKIISISRLYMEMADDSYDQGLYEDAAYYYSLVDIVDPDYFQAVSQCNISKEKMLLGKWRNSGDIAYCISDEAANCKYPATIFLVFNDDNTGYIDIEEKSVRHNYDSFAKDLGDYLYYYVLLAQKSYSEVDYIMKTKGYTSNADLAKNTVTLGDVVNKTNKYKELSKFSYYIEDDYLIIKYEQLDNNRKYTYSYDGVTKQLKLLSTSDVDYLAFLQINMPTAFTLEIDE